ncbi:hypothetical protein BDF14DRAFT_1745729 [Spinellus fusiger]|nr:hypothetical protein BDF14DRAFT_1745729 [Spinellus fusiger]
MSPLFLWESTPRKPAVASSHRAPAGPPPPPSWLPKAKQGIVRRHPSTLPSQQDVFSLSYQCAYSIAESLETQFISNATLCTAQFSSLSTNAKEHILKAFSILHQKGGNGLPDSLFYLFDGYAYKELCLEGASISMNILIRMFWQAWQIESQGEKKIQEYLAEDWEETFRNEEKQEGLEGLIYDPEDPEEDTLYFIHTVLRVLVGRKLNLSQCYLLSTPLSIQLTSLNLSFVRPFLPSTALAYLLSSTLPNLLVLSTAGTFSSVEGPQAIRILSRGLRKLCSWDIGHHEWIKADHLCGFTANTAIYWARDLQDLKVLKIQCLGKEGEEEVGAQVAAWLRDPPPEDRLRHLRRIKVLWETK